MSVSHFFSHYPTIEYKKAALYVRCSKEEQAKFGDTIEAQTEDLKEFARQHHLKVVDIYVDEGHTARKKYNKRKEFVRMLHDVELHKFQYIIFTKLDRWFRNISDFYKIQEILDSNGVTWLTALERYDREYTIYRCNIYTNTKLCSHNRGINEKKLESYLLEHIKPELEKYTTQYEISQQQQPLKADPSKIKTKLNRLRDLYINDSNFALE